MLIVLTGMPGAGKSYLATKLIYDAWKIDPDRKVFTNFPVRWKDKSSMKWQPEMVSENIQDSLIVIDEAYRDYNSRKFEKFSDDAHLTFATNRHNENTFIFISQNIARLDTVIREISEIWWVSKMAIPNPKHFFEFDRWRPIWFKVEMYDCLDSFKMKALMGKKAAYRTKRHRFNKEVAQMYDTHFYGDTTDEVFTSEPWYHIEKTEKRSLKDLIISGVIKNEHLMGYYLYLNHLSLHLTRIPHLTLRKTESKTEKNRKGMRRTTRYNLWEHRSLIREIAYRNWRLWRPIFIRIGLEPKMKSPEYYCET